MFQTLKRPYKESNAYETIEKIRNILNTADLAPRVVFHANPYPQIHSVRLELDETKGGFGTNGKGRDKEYCFASGYAEFIERMQNGLYANFSRTMMKGIKEKHDFFYAPDERYISKEEFLQLPDEIVSDIIHRGGRDKIKFIESYFNRLKVNNVSGVVSLPFYDTKNDREIFLPLNLLLLAVGSTGMAAGNTNTEAIFQAICEIMERWGAAEIFYNQLTPPTIPDEFLKQFEEEYKIIENIRKSGKYKVTIKDFSANRRIPAVGIIIEHPESQKYKLNVGCDTSFQVALSRCLTEIYQGRMNDKVFDEGLLDIPKEVADYFKNDDPVSLYKRYSVFASFTHDGSGIFPKSLFDDKFDYPFDSSIFGTKKSYDTEVKTLITNFHKMGYNVYIRDVSFMGFPSVFVYIPRVSVKGVKNAPIQNNSDTFSVIELDKIEPMVFNLKNCNDDELQQIADTLDKLAGQIKFNELFNVDLKPMSPWKNLEVSFLLTLIWYRLGALDKARLSFKLFLKEQKEEKEYYKIVDQYLDLKVKGIDEEKIAQKILKKGFDQKLVETVMQDMSDPDEIFKYIKLPKCPDCSGCELQNDCLTNGKQVIAHNIYPIMKENEIDQIRLSLILNGAEEGPEEGD
ncbi:MAG: YcaO-like family protein [bacterium]